MPRLLLVRHAEPAAAWGDHADPGLSPLGRTQAESAAASLRREPSLLAVTSPLLRCRETAAAFRNEARVEPAVAEIPTPAAVADRRVWLAALMGGRWTDAPTLAGWRQAVIEALRALRQDTAVFTHFVAINVAAGWALGRDEVLVFKPAHASVTILESGPDGLRLIALGDEAAAVTAL